MENTFLVGLRCLRCGTEYVPGSIEYVCACRPNVGSDLGTLDVEYDYDAIMRNIDPLDVMDNPDRSIGHYAFLLPVSGRASLPPLAVGNTPLLRADRLAHSVGLRQVYIKDDGRNPSASLKDRASAVAVAHAPKSLGPRRLRQPVRGMRRLRWRDSVQQRDSPM